MGKRKWAGYLCQRFGHAPPKLMIYKYKTPQGLRIYGQEWCPRCGEVFHDEVF